MLRQQLLQTPNVHSRLAVLRFFLASARELQRIPGQDRGSELAGFPSGMFLHQAKWSHVEYLGGLLFKHYIYLVST